jgi:hypothetical protein
VARTRVVGPRTFLAYKDYRYLKSASLGLLLAIGLYVVHRPAGGPSGGSWLGYTYGGIATLMIGWLMWFGVRKRSYHSSGPPLQGWLSAHVYLGLVLLVLVPLHCAFQFGWNVHTLAYALMAAVIVSGMVGVFFYASVPPAMTRNRPGQKLEALFQQIADIDSELKSLASGLPDHFAVEIARSVDETMVGGSVREQLRPDTGDATMAETLKRIRGFSHDMGSEPEQRGQVRRLLELLSLKQTQLRRIRRDLRYKALMDLWLVIHVPLSFATVAAVAVHVFVVFYYW